MAEEHFLYPNLLTFPNLEKPIPATKIQFEICMYKISLFQYPIIEVVFYDTHCIIYYNTTIFFNGKMG